MYSSYSAYNRLCGYSLYVVFFMTIVLVILEIKNIFNQKRFSLIVSLILIISVLLASIINNTGLGSVAILLILACAMLLTEIIKIDNKLLNIVCFIITIGDILFLLSKKTYYNTNVCGYLTFAMLPFSMTFLEGEKEDRKIRKIVGIILSVIIAIWSIIVIQNSESRGALLGFMVFIIMKFCNNGVLKNKKFYNAFIALILGSTLAFAFLYVRMWNRGVDFKIPFSDKSLYSGREAIWSELLEAYNGKENFLYGLGSKYNIHSFKVMNIHNSSLYILVIYGGINFIIYSGLLYSTLIKTNKYINNPRNKIFMAAIIGMLVVSFFETNIEWTDVNIYFILAMIFSCNINEKGNKNEKKIQRIDD